MGSHFVRGQSFVLFSLASLAALGCREAPAEQPAAKAPALTPAPAPRPATPEAPAPPPAPSESDDKPGWTRVSIRDELPLCVFPSYAAREAAPPFPNIKKQTLKANEPIVFGVYGPWCLNPACDDRLLVQCWVDPDGSTLHVHSRFASLRKDGADCSTDCMVLDAACETPPLPAGKYTIRHGEKTWPLVIPSVVRSPCFDPKAL